jgi:hypothetical protein
MAAWGVLYEGALQVTKTKTNPAAAIAGAATAYAIDYHLVPERLKPGIEKRMGPAGLFLAYAAMAATFALSSLWNNSEENSLS